MFFGKKKALDRKDPPRFGTSVVPVTATQREKPSPFTSHPGVTLSSYAIPEQAQKLRSTYVTRVVSVIDASKAAEVSDEVFRAQIAEIIHEQISEHGDALSQAEQEALVKAVTEDLLGFGPIEPLLNDETVTDILINGPDRVFVERNGIIEITDVKFIDSNHLMNVVQRIVNRVGRRVDTANPIVDARLPDGSRICVTIPPASVHFISVSIRKFMTDRMGLCDLVERDAMNADIAVLLQLIARLGLNVLISGGTGSGKTTLLNAMSQYIDPRERIVTIEDTAEVQLKQPNVVTLETRENNLEGKGSISMADLLKTSLRMRPNRIILGEVRDAAAGELLQAMNTGHSGSLGTIHANTPRDCLMRFENLCCMDPRYSPGIGTRAQMASAINIVVQVSRMSDGKRRVVSVSEVVGLEGDVFTVGDIIRFDPEDEDGAGNITGKWVAGTGKPRFLKDRKHTYLTDLEREMLRRLAKNFENSVDNSYHQA